MWAKDQEQLKKNVRKRAADRTEFKVKAQKAKRLSPGFLFSEGQLCLTSDDVFNAFKQKAVERDLKAKDTVRKHMKEYMKTQWIQSNL